MATSPERRQGCFWWLGRVAGGFLLLIVLLLGASSLYGAFALHRDRQAYPPPGQLVNVGGQTRHLHCTGNGAPTVVLEAGLGDWMLAWRQVQPEVATFTRVCSYDRAGLGWSAPGRWPRTGQQIASELQALLAEAGEIGPYVLVGHSAGGLYAQIYADQYPDDVAGLVLIDAPASDANPPAYQPAMEAQYRVMAWLVRLGLIYTIGLLAGDQVGTDALPAYVARLSQQERESYLVTSLTSFDTIADEWAIFDETLAQMGALHPLRDKPATVLVARATLTENGLAEPVRSPILPEDTAYLIVEQTGHFIQADQPQVVIAAIRQIATAARRSLP